MLSALNADECEEKETIFFFFFNPLNLPRRLCTLSLYFVHHPRSTVTPEHLHYSQSANHVAALQHTRSNRSKILSGKGCDFNIQSKKQCLQTKKHQTSRKAPQDTQHVKPSYRQVTKTSKIHDFVIENFTKSELDWWLIHTSWSGPNLNYFSSWTLQCALELFLDVRHYFPLYTSHLSV